MRVLDRGSRPYRVRYLSRMSQPRDTGTDITIIAGDLFKKEVFMPESANKIASIPTRYL